MKSALTLKSLLIATGVSVLAMSAHAGTDIKNPIIDEIAPEAESWWSATLSTGIESKYMFRGMDQYAFGGGTAAQSTLVRGNSPLVWTNLEASAYGLTVGLWYGDNLVTVRNPSGPALAQAGFNELDIYVDYTYSFGPVDASVGYIGYLFPGNFGTKGAIQDLNEFYLGAAYTALPYVTPSVTWYQGFGDVANQGRYLEVRLDGSIPVYKDIVTFEPYALVSYSDYQAAFRSNWNHYQLGANVTWQVNKIISVFGGLNYSGPLDIVSSASVNGGDPGYHVNSDIWGGGGIAFTF